MEKVYTALLFLFISAALCSCVGDDRSDCPPTTTSFTVTFDLAEQNPARAGADDFLDDIENVHVFLFDEQRRFVESKEVSRDELVQFLGTTFEVTPGQYHVMAWGNSQPTELAAGTTMDESFIQIAPGTTGNPIYYAPEKAPTFIGETADYTIYSAEVVGDEENVMPVSFVNAHRKVVVYVRGFEYTRWYKDQPPVLQAVAAGTKYDFLLGADPTPNNISHTAELVTTPDGPRYMVTFYASQIPLNENKGINLYCCWDVEATGEPIIPTIYLSDWFDEHQLTNPNDMVIEIYFTQDSRVEIGIPSWIDNPVIQ